jgi:hypothetical protein
MPTQAISGRVGNVRDHARVERGPGELVVAELLSGRDFGRDVRPWTALCSSIGWPTMSPTAKMCATLVRIWMSTGTAHAH